MKSLIIFICFITTQTSFGLTDYPIASEWPYGTSQTSETWSDGSTNLLFYGEGSTLRIANIDDPTNITVISEVRTGNKVEFIDISDDGTLAAVSNRINMVNLINIQNPNSPLIIGQYDKSSSPGGGPYGLSFVNNNLLMVAMSIQGVRALDISNPTNITVVGDYIEPGGLNFVFDVEVLGNYAFMTDIDEGISAIDISDPSNMSLSDRFTGAFNAKHISIKGNTAYVSRGGEGVSILNFDVSGNPAVITDLGTINPNIFPRGPSGGNVFRSELLDNGLLAVADDSFQNGVVLLDISNLASPVVIGGTPRAMGTLSANGNYAFSSPTEFFHGIYAYKLDEMNMGIPQPPLEVDFMPLFTSSDEVDVSGDFVTISNSDQGSGMIIMDISNPSNPIVSSWINNIDTIVSAVKLNNTVAMAQRSDHLTLMDVSDLQNPVLLPNLVFPGGAFVQQVEEISDHEVLVAAGSVGIRWVDLTDPLMPVITSSWTEPSNAGIGRLAIQGDLVVAASNTNVWLIDFTNKLSPTVVNSFSLPSNVKDFDIDNNHLYIADGISHLRIWDITTPSNISDVAIFNIFPSTANGIKVINDIAYLATGKIFGLIEIDVSVPSSPVLISTTSINDSAEKIDGNGNVLVLADAETGIKIWSKQIEINIFNDGFE